MLGFILFGLPFFACVLGYQETISRRINNLFIKNQPKEQPVIHDINDDFQVIFNRPLWTPVEILFILFSILITITILIKIYSIYVYLGNKRVLSMLLVIIILWLPRIRNYFASKKIELNNQGFLIDDKYTEWAFVERVDFILVGRLEVTSQRISIKLKDKTKISIIPGLYSDRKYLRDLFEKILISKGIKVTVEERGW